MPICIKAPYKKPGYGQWAMGNGVKQKWIFYFSYRLLPIALI
jgi:hypothetical protein